MRWPQPVLYLAIPEWEADVFQFVDARVKP
jgi:hypothetical protein